MGSTASSADLVTITRYDAQGRIIESRLPAGASGGDARSTLTTYYTATGTGSCVSAAQVGLTCTTSPAAQPTTGAALPVTTTTYDMYYNVKTVAAVYGSSANRTDSTTYDAAERPLTSSTVVSPVSAGGTAVPPVTTGYDSSTGLPVTASSSAATLTTGYDTLGRVTSYTDASGTVSTTGYDIDGNRTTATDGKATTTWTYDSSTEHRGLVTGENVGAGSAPSTFAAVYDPAGNLATQTYPNGLTAITTNDNAGNDTSLTYTKAGATWMTFTTTPGSDDKTHNQTGPESSQTYNYDNADRLMTVQDTDSTNGVATCTTRAYAFDKNSNRTGLTAYSAAADGTCTTATTPATTTATFDQADRLTTTGYAYDTLGRSTTVPTGDAQGIGAHAVTTGELTVGYYANDMVSSQTQGGIVRTYTLDPAQNRISGFVDGSTTTTEHYNDGSDSPTWTATGTTWDRDIEGINGDLAATQDQTGTVVLQLSNLHGDIVATAADDTAATSISSYNEATEYGLSRDAGTAPTTYGWLGEKERSSDTMGGLILMGVRLYNASTGRFLQIDPVTGGSANSYAYPTNPVDGSDVSGQMWSGWNQHNSYRHRHHHRHRWHRWHRHHHHRHHHHHGTSSKGYQSFSPLDWFKNNYGPIGGYNSWQRINRHIPHVVRHCVAWGTGGAIAGSRGGAAGAGFGFIGGCAGSTFYDGWE